MSRLRLLAAFAALALVAPGSAAAHARLVRTVPSNGAVLSLPPRQVQLFFDDDVRVLAGNEAVRNGGGSILTGKPSQPAGRDREVVIPLRANLQRGDYSVRWRVLSDDGHVEQGVLAFAVGTGRAPPRSVLSVGGGLSVRALLSRWLFFLGLLVAVGAGGFIVLMRGIEPTRPLVLMFGGFLCAFFGAAGLASTHHSLSRADLAYGAGAIVSALGAAVTAIRLFERGLPLLPLPFALLLLPVPAFAGHAFDPGQPRALSVAADVVHLAAASVWVGGLAALAVTRSSRDVVKRYLTVAVASVAVLGTAGVIRALIELTAVSQLWSSGYGRAVLVKTALLAALVGFALSRRIAPAQVVLIGGVIVAVAFLTDLPPGRALAPPASPPVLAAKAPPPPSGSLVLAREAGDLAVAVAVRPAGAGLGVQTSVLGQDGFGVPGLQVRIGSAPGSPCGVGCYRATLNARPPVLVIRIGAATAAFRMPRRWPPPRADVLVRRTARAYRRLKTVVIHERLASGPRLALETTYELEAPDRLAYQIAGGPAAVVIGSRRWDRLQPGGRWQRSAQTPLPQPTPIWRSAVDAHVLGSARVAGRPVWLVSFLDPSVPAWFTVWIEKSTFRPLELRMTAAAHFMHHRYGSFNAPLRITPPVR